MHDEQWLPGHDLWNGRRPRIIHKRCDGELIIIQVLKEWERHVVLLALSVIGTDAVRLGLNGYKVFDERGGIIGRLESCAWILRDPAHLVSASHARILHRNHAYFLEDTSSNGTFINDPERPAPHDTVALLHDGDRLFIGSFEIPVQLIDDLPIVVASTPQADWAVLPQLSVDPQERSAHATDRHRTPSTR